MEDIRLENLAVRFPVKEGAVDAVDDVTVTFKSGEITGIIGESGCGKSVLGMAILGLLPAYAHVSGEIWLEEKDLLELTPKQMRNMRGRKIGLIAQNPGDSLNPVRKVGGQLMEALRLNARERRYQSGDARRLLEDFGFSAGQAGRVWKSYPFQLSGGMQQRTVAAMGIASGASWILADEPSKGLDEELREQMYETLRKVKNHHANGMLIITHDIVLAEKLCDSVAVMYSGQIVEKGSSVIANPRHPYTKGLIASLPSNGMHPMKGLAPAPGEELRGCKFAPRCPHGLPECMEKRPETFEDESGMVRCFLYG